jgi:hypothetical protein
MKISITLFLLLTIQAIGFSQKNDPKIDSLLQKDIREGQPILNDYRKTVTINSPLFIVDDKEMASDKIANIDPNDIESIHVLKGKEAIELYSKKGENGVVIIKLKNSKDSLETKPRSGDL